MTSLRNKIWIFREYGGSNAEDKSEGGSGDQEEIENQLKKGLEKNQPSCTIVRSMP